ncbi:MAG: ABC transporter permease [Acidobacteriales bacterium]|nr:ABC transporter permease [Terriglobales bacterium]
MQALGDLLGQTFRGLWAHKLRTFLTMFGIAWGVGSLLLLVGLGEGFRTGNQRQLAEIGENIIMMWPGVAPAVAGQHNAGKRYYLTEQDAADIATQAPHVKIYAPILQRGDIRAVSQYQNYGPQLQGVPLRFPQLRNIPMDKGRWFNQSDYDEKRNVVILCDEPVKQLFPNDAPVIGSSILLNGVDFKVIGTVKKIGRDGGMNGMNARAFIPFPAFKSYWAVKGDNVPTDAVSVINYSPVTREDHELAKQEVHHIVARNHGGFDETNEEAFEEWDTVKSADMVGKIFTAMDMFLGSVGIVTLALGAIGVINIMLVSVTERTQEIGLRKALGATSFNVLAQFCFEGAFLTIGSGLLGMAVAWGFMLALHQLPSPPGFDPPTLVPASAAIAIASLALAGVAAGLYPASQAAKLQPIEALRRD